MTGRIHALQIAITDVLEINGPLKKTLSLARRSENPYIHLLTILDAEGTFSIDIPSDNRIEASDVPDRVNAGGSDIPLFTAMGIECPPLQAPSRPKKTRKRRAQIDRRQRFLLLAIQGGQTPSSSEDSIAHTSIKAA